jgi:hypothetical protein
MKSTDISPIVNYAWEQSLAKIVNNQKAIMESGWFPLLRALLAHPSVLETKLQSSDSN